MRLADLAQARSGDKGDIADITVIARSDEAYDRLTPSLTAEAVASYLGSLRAARVERFEIPHLRVLKFVLHGALDGGVTVSLRLDAHGKCISGSLLDMEIGR